MITALAILGALALTGIALCILVYALQLWRTSRRHRIARERAELVARMKRIARHNEERRARLRGTKP